MPVRMEMAEQFENENAMRRFPFADWASLVSEDGKELPDSLIADARFCVPFRDGTDCVTSVRLESAHVSPAMVSVCFRAYAGVSPTDDALSVTVSAASFRPYFPYALKPLSGYPGMADAGGVIAFGSFDFPTFPETYRFSYAEILPCCVAAATPSGLRSITDPRSGESVSGDVGFSFSGHVDASLSGGGFSLSLDPGSAEELMSRCVGLAEGDGVCGATPIRSINGVAPDPDGNIVLLFR